MRILVTVKNSPKQMLLVTLDKEAVRDVKSLLNKRKRDKAIMTALIKGEFVGCVSNDNARKTNADLILTREGAYWNL